jgi:hypothetical protein
LAFGSPPGPDNLGRIMGLCVSLTASFWEGKDRRYGNQGRSSGNVVLCWCRRVSRGSARHPCERDHRRSSRAGSRVDTRCARRMALSSGQHLAGGWEAPQRSSRRSAFPIRKAGDAEDRMQLNRFACLSGKEGLAFYVPRTKMGRPAHDNSGRNPESADHLEEMEPGAGDVPGSCGDSANGHPAPSFEGSAKGSDAAGAVRSPRRGRAGLGRWLHGSAET